MTKRFRSPHLDANSTPEEIAAAARYRIDAQSIPEPNSGCWIWIGPVHPHAHDGKPPRPMVTYQGKSRPANRVSYEVFRGPIGPGLLACHRCDNTLCVNPEHLFLGTNRENILDCAKKRRVSNLKLTVEQVREIRVSPLNNSELGRLFGVDNTQISRVRRGKAFTYVE